MAEKKSKEYYEFKKKMKELKKLKGEGTELISVYIPPGANVNEVSTRLRDEYGQAANIKSKQTRKNVQSAIDRIIQMLKGVHKPPENGVAIFCGTVHENIVFFNIIPPEPVQVSVYRCDSTFFLDPLEDLIEPKEVFGAFTIDRREATVAVLKGKRVDIIKILTSGVPGKHHKGGQSAQRFERLIEQAAHEFFQRVGETCNQVFQDPKVKGVLVGGPGPTKYDFMKGDYLQTAVKDKIVGTIDTGYTDEYGIKEIMDRSGEIIQDLEITREKDLINKFLKASVTGGLATYGESEVRQALSEGKVDTLLLSEALEWRRLKLKCITCQKTREVTVKDMKKFEPPKCECGGKYETVEDKELTEDLSELAEAMGSKVEMISSDTPEGQQLFSGFGGIGALLRYR